jgi:fumarate hydratase subunit alpha
LREISVGEVTEKVRAMCIRAARELPADVLDALKKAAAMEESPVGRDVLAQLCENAEIARKDSMPLCQDTGVAILFVEVGQDVHIAGGAFEDAINEGVRLGYAEGFLRKSLVWPPVGERKNTGDNTPAIIHCSIVPGDKLALHFMAKGGGSENMSCIAMLKPSDGLEGAKKFILETVEKAWANPCPPIVIGIGIGGNFEKSALMAKHSLLHEIGLPNADPFLDSLEKELLESVNSLGIGPGGLGGRVTALAVNIEWCPCHIASLPVAVNIECHSHRHLTEII